MSYVEQLLSRGEQVRYVARQHLFVLIASILAELALIALLVAAGVVAQAALQSSDLLIGSLTASDLILMICAGLTIIVIISGTIDYLRWSSDQCVITDHRVIQVRGVITKQVIDSSLEKITDVELRQSFLGRLLDFGTIAILTGAGDEGANVIDRIAAPVEFKRALIEAKHYHEQGYGYVPEPAYQRLHTPLSEELNRLADLRDRGILSPEEFETQKRLLLKRTR